MKIKNLKLKIILLTIISLGFFLRVYGLNWDQGFHLHPDERAIVLASLPLQFPTTISEFLSIQSPLNPHFFAYGSLPMYLLKGIAVLLTPFYSLAPNYDHINLVGRFLSALFDTGTVFLIFILGKKLFSKTIGLTASFFYATSVFPIQAAHFYAVDTPLTFFILSTVYILILFYEKPSKNKALLIGLLFGLSLATKTSALVLIVSIVVALISDFVLIFIKKPHRTHVWLPHIPKLIKTLFTDGLIITITTFMSFIIFEPYALLDFQEFWRQTLQQSQMTHDAFTFPYTLQYVGKIPYFYELKNIFLWGQGPILATLSFLGTFYILFLIIKKSKQKKWAQEFILLIFFLSYFAIVGKFAVGWMRYMLPLYPLLCLFAGLFILKLYTIIKNILKINTSLFIILNSLFIILVLTWPLSFMHIYTKPNTRVIASKWIYQNIPPDKTVAREHWDDGLPIGGNIFYKILELPIYDMEDSLREVEIYQSIQKADYIIIASNRLYVPLQRLANNCSKWNLPKERCSKNANKYYEKLFNGELGFKKVAEFSIYPKLEIGNWKLEIQDIAADESFTVYDHPKVIVFQKIP